MVLGSRVCPVTLCEPCSLTIPTDVQAMFGDDLVLGGDKQRLFVTLGQFSIIRLERPAQIIVPVLDYAIPPRSAAPIRAAAPRIPALSLTRSPSLPTPSPPRAATDREIAARTDKHKPDAENCIRLEFFHSSNLSQ